MLHETRSSCVRLGDAVFGCCVSTFLAAVGGVPGVDLNPGAPSIFCFGAQNRASTPRLLSRKPLCWRGSRHRAAASVMPTTTLSPKQRSGCSRPKPLAGAACLWPAPCGPSKMSNTRWSGLTGMTTACTACSTTSCPMNTRQPITLISGRSSRRRLNYEAGIKPGSDQYSPLSRFPRNDTKMRQIENDSA